MSYHTIALQMDTLHLTVGEKFDHDISAEDMSILLVNDASILTFNFSVTEKNYYIPAQFVIFWLIFRTQYSGLPVQDRRVSRLVRPGFYNPSGAG